MQAVKALQSDSSPKFTDALHALEGCLSKALKTARQLAADNALLKRDRSLPASPPVPQPTAVPDLEAGLLRQAVAVLASRWLTQQQHAQLNALIAAAGEVSRALGETEQDSLRLQGQIAGGGGTALLLQRQALLVEQLQQLRLDQLRSTHAFEAFLEQLSAPSQPATPAAFYRHRDD